MEVGSSSPLWGRPKEERTLSVGSANLLLLSRDVAVEEERVPGLLQAAEDGVFLRAGLVVVAHQLQGAAVLAHPGQRLLGLVDVRADLVHLPGELIGIVLGDGGGVYAGPGEAVLPEEILQLLRLALGAHGEQAGLVCVGADDLKGDGLQLRGLGRQHLMELLQRIIAGQGADEGLRGAGAGEIHGHVEPKPGHELVVLDLHPGQVALLLRDAPAELQDLVGLLNGGAAVALHDAVVVQRDGPLALEGGEHALFFGRAAVEDLQGLFGHLGVFLVLGTACAGVHAVEDIGVMVGVDLDDALPLQRFKDLFSVGI